LTACSVFFGRKYMMASSCRISLLPRESTCSLSRVSMPPSEVMWLEKSERLVRLVRLSRPVISEMLLNERSSACRLTRWSRFSIFSMILLSSCSLTSLSNPFKLSILRMFWYERINVCASRNWTDSFLRSSASPWLRVFTAAMHFLQSSSSITAGSGPDMATNFPIRQKRREAREQLAPSEDQGRAAAGGWARAERRGVVRERQVKEKGVG